MRNSNYAKHIYTRTFKLFKRPLKTEKNKNYQEVPGDFLNSSFVIIPNFLILILSLCKCMDK